MAEEVPMKLIFANDNASAEVTVPTATVVRDLKRQIMEKHWPPGFTDIETVERIRLFAGGREVGGKGPEDQKPLKDAKLPPRTDYPMPVHIQPVLKCTEASTERETTAKPSQCLCTIL
mmetsp:Transcript_30802/g.65205  ORF Transcript_30802/g.65205 Transcript_30802/m.65205 type:complete len:118 (+) Transcript_30802:169-522(+)